MNTGPESYFCGMRLAITILMLLFLNVSLGQNNCNNLGQTPATAFPVCGTKVFTQNQVPICSNGNVKVPGCNDGTDYEFKNPYWYKFTCFTSGTLGFVITPLNLSDDYDWHLYDITGRQPNDVLSNPNLTVTANWAGTSGTTGTSGSGVNYIQCSSVPSDNKPTFAKMPNIVAGHTYLLMVSHFTNTQSGYTLSFNGGTAVITDPLDPHVSGGGAFCDGKEITVRFNKHIRCSSLAANGSDFRINLAGFSPTSAVAQECSAGFDFKEVKVVLNNALPPGTHKLFINKGSDGNTLLDDCDREVPESDSVEFTLLPLVPTMMDSITPVQCEPKRLELYFKKPIKCGSFTANGSEFTITGPSPVSVIGASGNCGADKLSKSIYIDLAQPIQMAGTYTVHLKLGTDGNTIEDECGQVTPPMTVDFAAYDTVNAAFDYTIQLHCDKNVVNYNHPGGNNINSWAWTLPATSTLQNPTAQYTEFSPKNISLIVGNGVCSDTSNQKIIFDNYQKAAFATQAILCPGESATFNNLSVGNLVAYQWLFGNGSTSADSLPPAQHYVPNVSTDYIALPMLITTNNYGCKDTATQNIKVVFSCFVAVPSAFTPNGDGLNDYLYPLVAYNAKNLQFSVYNRFGQRVFYTETPFAKWDGRLKGQDAQPGTYVWQLRYLDTKANTTIYQKGTVILIR